MPGLTGSQAVLVARTDIAIGDGVTPDMAEIKRSSRRPSWERHDRPSASPAAEAVVRSPAGRRSARRVVGAVTKPNLYLLCPASGEKAIAFQVADRSTTTYSSPGDHIDVVVNQRSQSCSPRSRP
jgi:Flp pilus assembly protein CpaB